MRVLKRVAVLSMRRLPALMTLKSHLSTLLSYALLVAHNGRAWGGC
jgi:hypothetical protein